MVDRFYVFLVLAVALSLHLVVNVASAQSPGRGDYFVDALVWDGCFHCRVSL